MTTRLYSHDIFLEHVTPPGHPERPDRIRAVWEALADEAAALIDSDRIVKAVKKVCYRD